MEPVGVLYRLELGAMIHGLFSQYNGKPRLIYDGGKLTFENSRDLLKKDSLLYVSYGGPPSATSISGTVLARRVKNLLEISLYILICKRRPVPHYVQ